MRWPGRRLALAHMLRLPVTSAIWERIHRRYRIAAPLYLDTTLCLQKLRAGIERDMGRDPSEPDLLFGGEFTLRERFAMMNRLLEHRGMDPPQRRSRRVTMASPARIINGFEHVANVLPAVARDGLPTKSIDLQIKIDDTSQTLTRAKLRAASRVGPARVIDGSNGGLGVALRRQDAKWAALGVLVAVCIEPGKDWVVGVVRRIFTIDEELRLDIQVLSTRAGVVSISTETSMKRDHAWEEAIKYEATFKERYKKAIVLDPSLSAAGDLVLEPGLASKGTQFDVLRTSGPQRIRVVRMLQAGESYQRAICEPLS